MEYGLQSFRVSHLCSKLLAVDCVFRARQQAGGSPVEVELGSRVAVGQAGYVHSGGQGQLHCGEEATHLA